MSGKEKPTHTSPGTRVGDDGEKEDGVVNDSLGTVDPADSTGTDERNETGDAGKAGNREQK